MVRYSDETIEDVRNSNDIVDVISRLRRAKEKRKELFWIMSIS